MIAEGVVALQEIGIVPACLITGCVPGGVHIVVLAIELHNVPAVGAAVADAADHTGIHTGFQSQTVEGGSIALTYAAMLNQSAVGAVHFQVVIIDHVAGQVIVNFTYLFIVGQAGKLADDAVDRGVNLRFLIRGGVVGEGIGIGYIDRAVFGVA